jgi:hypothetical protein
MKKIISFLLVALLLFNVLGYYGLFMGLHYQNKKQLIQRFDGSDYNESEAVTIKIPITVPYATDSKDFQRVDGEFEHQGEFYHMVKQRLSQDTLYIVCVKDKTSKRIHEALTDYVKTFTDKPVDAKSSAKSLPTFIKEYMTIQLEIKHLSDGWVQNVDKLSSTVVFIDSYQSSIVHPPERI